MRLINHSFFYFTSSKNRLASRILFFTLFLFSLTSCSNDTTTETNQEIAYYYQATGRAQGTTYSIVYKDKEKRNLSHAIDSVPKKVDQELSIYVDSSTISKVNQLAIDSVLLVGDKQLFQECYGIAKEVYLKTNFSFNPALYPLVKYWGFLNFEKGDLQHQQSEIDSLLLLIDFSDKAIALKSGELTKHKFCNIDFNAVAQGYSVDVIAKHLESLGIQNYMVEVGGELKTKGKNAQNGDWRIGIDKPIENTKPGEKEFQIIVSISGKSLATSGSYRKFYEKKGVKYSHTINPFTGKPVQHQLLSTTVVADNCGKADAYATAFMVMGVEKTKEFLAQNKELNLSVYLVYSQEGNEWGTWQTESFNEIIL